MLSGAAWKDTPSCSIGGTGPYIPRMLLGKFDGEEIRERRRQFYRQWKKDLQARDYLAAVKLMREEGMVSEKVAAELEGKVHDEDGEMLLEGSNGSFCKSSYSDTCAGRIPELIVSRKCPLRSSFITSIR